MKNKFPKFFEHSHEPDAIAARLRAGTKQSYLKDFVYGSIDGTITTFAVVSGVIGAELEVKTILILGVANLLADGFSMAASNYSGTKTENQERELTKEYENSEIDNNPIGEANEVRQILIKKGYTGDLLEKNLEFILSNRKRWLNLMLLEEYGISGLTSSPLKAGGITFLAFVCFGSIPLLSYALGLENPFLWATILTGISFLMIGSLKSQWTIENSFIAALKTLLLGSGAAAIAYSVGYGLKDIF